MKKKKELCQHCNKRIATENTVGMGGILDFVHGFYQRWCKRCVLEAQLQYAKEHSRDVAILEEKLKSL